MPKSSCHWFHFLDGNFFQHGYIVILIFMLVLASNEAWVQRGKNGRIDRYVVEVTYILQFPNMQESAKICKYLQESTIICKNMQEFSRICKNLQDSASILKILQASSRLCKNPQNSARSAGIHIFMLCTRQEKILGK